MAIDVAATLALEAWDAGYRMIASDLNWLLSRHTPDVLIDAEQMLDGWSLSEARKRLKTALNSIPIPPPEIDRDIIYPWTFGLTNGLGNRHYGISLDGYLNDDKALKWLDRNCGNWTPDQWRTCIKEPVEAYAAKWRDWLTGLARPESTAPPQ
jgi:hypothetical protein